MGPAVAVLSLVLGIASLVIAVTLLLKRERRAQRWLQVAMLGVASAVAALVTVSLKK